MDQIETDPDLKVVVFDSADPEYFIAHYDMARAGEKQQTPKEIELPAWIDFAARLYRTSVVTIAEIRGRARGVGSEFALACDMRFASEEKAIFGQPEVGVGVVPGEVPTRLWLGWRDVLEQLKLFLALTTSMPQQQNVMDGLTELFQMKIYFVL